MPASHFAKNILFLRKKRKINQSEIHARLDIKASTWSNYENGITEPNIETIIKISKEFGVSIDALLTTELSEVQVNANSSNLKKGANNTGKGTGNDTGNSQKQGQTDNHDVDKWVIIKLLREQTEKLDRLLNIAEKKL